MLEYARRLRDLARPYRSRVILGVLAGMLAGAIEPLLMVAVKLSVDGIFPGNHEDAIGLAKGWIPGFVRNAVTAMNHALNTMEPRQRVIVGVCSVPIVMVLRGLFGYLNVYFLQWAAVRTITDLRTKLFAHLVSLPLGFFNRLSTGELISRISNDTAMMQNSISNQLSVVVRDPVTLISLFVFLLVTHPAWSLITLVTFPVCIIPIAIYSRKVRKSSVLIQDEFARLSQIIHETFTGNRIVKAYNLESTVVDSFRHTARNYVNHYMRVVRSLEIPTPLIESAAAIGVAIFFLYIGFAKAPAAPGDLLQFVGSVFLMYKPVKALTRLHNNVEQSRAASGRVFELLALRSDLPEPDRAKPLRAAGQDVRFESVDFNYGEKPVLHDIRLTVGAGQFVALVGASGSGKTTLTNLLLRFYDPQRGSVRIGQTDIREFATRDLRGQIAVVTQETILFNTSIRENIRMGRPTATDAEVEDAARHAFAYDFIREKPGGFETVIGERGVLLSGGQRQRLAIARAILKDAPILVLDEATSALDTESERAVQAALDELAKGRTTFCIAHRLSTIQQADVIVVLDQGRVVEQGTHSQLLAQDGVYRRLHELQFQV